MRAEDFFLYKTEPDIQIRPAGDHYKYVYVYIDDLVLVINNSQAFIIMIRDKHKFKLKGTGPINYYLETNFSRNKNGAFSYLPRNTLRNISY